MATPRQVYNALIAAGASTTQAVGIMANMINESGFDEEAVGDNGTSFGLVQEHGSQYASLVTGNRQRDFNAQIKLLAQNGGFAAASGATPSEAAGNFAAKYERCKGCQPGGAQWESRVGNVSTVSNWILSGKWPKSAGSPSGGGTTLGGNIPQTGPGCLLANPFSASLPLIGNVSAGPSCIFSTSQARALIGGLLMAPALVMGLTGVVLLVALGFRRVAPGAGKAAETVGAGLAFVPGLEGAGLAVAGAGAAAQRTPQQSVERRRRVRRENASEDRELEQRGASDLRTARRPQNRAAVRPGRVTGSAPGPGRSSPRPRPRETGRQRARRAAGTGQGAASRSEAGF